MKMRLSTALWMQATVASAIATFESIEEYVCAIGFLWLGYFINRTAARRTTAMSFESFVSCIVVIGLSTVFVRAATRSYELEPVHRCSQKISRIANALLEYKDKYKTLPASKLRTGDGSKLSWRVAILPLLSDQTRIDQDLNTVANVFSGSQFGSTASYFAVTGKQTAWETWQSHARKIGDDPAKTILLLEELGRGFNWYDPRDLKFEAALELLTQPVGGRYVHLGSGKPGYFERKNPQRNREGVNAAFADGSVRFIPLPLSQDLASALLTSHGGEQISESDMRTLWRRELDYGKICSFSIFAVCSLLPVLRILQSRRVSKRITEPSLATAAACVNRSITRVPNRRSRS